MMRHGSLFSGIGGFDLAAEWMGWENIFHCEWNEFGQRVLKHYWPNAISYADITKTDFSIHRGGIDILTGGFPCQPFSIAGSRKGSDDNRYLWPEMLRAIKEIRPTWIIGENVAGITTMVQPGEVTKVEGQASLFDEDFKIETLKQEFVIESICKDIESVGYSVQPLVIPACAIGAPHRRDRVWFIAFSGCERCDNGGNNRKERQIQDNTFRDAKEDQSERNGWKRRFSEVGSTSSNSMCERSQWRSGKRISEDREWCCNSKIFAKRCNSGKERRDWEEFPTQPSICVRNDGISSRLDGITFPKWREESVKAGGNAIVPQVVLEIFQVIEQLANERIH